MLAIDIYEAARHGNTEASLCYGECGDGIECSAAAGGTTAIFRVIVGKGSLPLQVGAEGEVSLRRGCDAALGKFGERCCRGLG